MAEKFKELAENLIDDVGGKENVTQFFHCITRLRFKVKDTSKVDDAAIKKLHGVIGTQWMNDQYQVIIGQDVDDAYKLICKQYGFEETAAIDENLDAGMKKKKKFSWKAFFQALSACIIPLLPMLIAGGMIKAVILALSTFGLMNAEGGTYITLNFVSNVPFYFLPIAIGYTGAKQFGANPAIGMMLGGILIHPTLIEMVNAGDAGSIYGLNIPEYSYASTIFPMILTMFVAGYVERFFAKVSPKAVRSVLEPTLTILVMIPIELCLLAPLGNYISKYLGIAIMFLYDTIGPFGMALFAAFSPYLVMTGMHLCLDPYTADALATTGKEMFVGPAMFVRNFNQGVSCVVVAIKAKHDENLRSTAVSCAISAICAGITEPALFGINLKYRKPLYCAMFGSFFGGLYAGFTHVARYAYGGSGIFGLAVFVGDDPMNLVNELIAVAISAVITFIVGMIFIKPEDLTEEAANR